MINSTQNHLLNQMQALESVARGQAVQSALKPEQGPDFGELMQQAINQVNETQMQASSLRQSFELGENVDLSEVMIAVQKSQVSFEALTQVRDLERGGYLLGYYLDEPLSPKQLAKVNVKSVRKGVRILHRRGYYAGDALARSAGGSLVLGVPLSLEEDGRTGQFVPFTIVADPERLGYEPSEEKARANLTLSVRVSSVDGRSLTETFHHFGHAYPLQTWQTGQAEQVEIRGWTECPPGKYRINVLLRNPNTGDRIEASQELTVPAGG